MSIFQQSNSLFAWSAYLRALELISGISANPAYVIQPLAIAKRIDWDTESKLFNLYLQQEQANRIPVWGPLYSNSGGSVSEDYEAFLDRLVIQLITKLPKEKQRFLGDLDNKRKDTRKAYRNYSKEVSKNLEIHLQSLSL